VLASFGARLLLQGKALDEFTTQVLAWHLPKWFAQAAAWTALVGGALLGLGFLTRIAALACAVVTGVILVKAKLPGGWQDGMQLSLIALAGCLSLALSGAGRFSVDRRLFGGP
jgi:uncharacterized membrane protein YphA (DoxX/SURF4 family)